MSPYRDAAEAYYRAGWAPIPLRGKGPPPDGWTGANGAWPSFADVYAWAEGPEGDLNVGLRLPAHVLGIDVDDYDNKHGGRTLAAAEAQYGPLPATWTSSARDGVSGIRFYQVPEGLAWPGQLAGGSVELIQYRHRYAVAWPSVHLAIRRTYMWRDPLGYYAQHYDEDLHLISPSSVPNVDELPLLPQPWIDGLTAGRLQADIPKADLGDPQAALWLAEHGGGQPCAALSRALVRYEQELTLPGASRHDTAVRATSRLARMVVEGHTGGLIAAQRLKASFELATVGERRPGEWGRLLTGAVRIAAVDDVLDGDPCDAGPFGIVRPISSAPSARLLQEGISCSVASPGSSSITVSSVSSAGTAGAPSTSPASAADGSPTVLAATLPDPSHLSAEVLELPGHSWRGVDLAAALDCGDEDAPSVFRRHDGAALFYLGRVNGLIGPSESGKSWVALEAVRQELDAGQVVAFVDFEDTARGLVRRMEKLGVDRAVLLKQFRYIAPDEPPGPAALAAILDELDAYAPRLVVIDGVNAAMTLAGLDLNSNTDATKFYQGLLWPLVREDRALCYVDHTPKSKGDESRGGIGAQAKRAMTSGTALRVDKKSDFGPGSTGYLRLFVDKDRMGYVREISHNAEYVAEAIIRGGDDGNPVTIELAEYDPEKAGEASEKRDVLELRTTIARVIGEHPGISKRGLLSLHIGGRERVVEALDHLISGEFVMVVHVDGANRHHLRRAYPGAFE